MHNALTHRMSKERLFVEGIEHVQIFEWTLILLAEHLQHVHILLLMGNAVTRLHDLIVRSRSSVPLWPHSWNSKGVSVNRFIYHSQGPLQTSGGRCAQLSIRRSRRTPRGANLIVCGLSLVIVRLEQKNVRSEKESATMAEDIPWKCCGKPSFHWANWRPSCSLSGCFAQEQPFRVRSDWVVKFHWGCMKVRLDRNIHMAREGRREGERSLAIGHAMMDSGTIWLYIDESLTRWRL